MLRPVGKKRKRKRLTHVCVLNRGNQLLCSMFRSSMHKTQRNKVWAVQDGTILSNVDEAISPNFAEPRCSKIVNEMSSSLAAMYRFKELSINNDVPRNSTPPPLQPPRLSSRHTRKAKTYNPQLADISSIRESTTAAKADAWDVALPLLDYQDSLLSSLSSSISLSSPQTPSKPTSAFLAAAAAASSATCSSGYTLPSHPLDPPTLRPSPSTRLKNAFRRLSMQEVVHSRSSSLAERIKSKFQQRSSIKRSTSLSSISSSWSRFSKPSRKSNSSTVTVSPLESKMQVHDSE